jgi:FkbM family methyltransferase
MHVHHPIFSKFQPFHPIRNAEGNRAWALDWTGVNYRHYYNYALHFNTGGENIARPMDYLETLPVKPIPRLATTDEASVCFPKFNEEYFEWIDVCEAVAAAQGSFTIVELGAGFGRWIVSAVGALRKLKPDMPYHLVAVEAEPTHFEWIATHLNDNGIDPAKHRLLKAAVSDKSRFVYFETGNPEGWYGQSIRPSSTTYKWLAPTLFTYNRLRDATINRFPGLQPYLRRAHPMEIMKSISLADVLKGIECVDLLDMDIQGAEWEVLSVSAALLEKKVTSTRGGAADPAGRKLYFCRDLA